MNIKLINMSYFIKQSTEEKLFDITKVLNDSMFDNFFLENFEYNTIKGDLRRNEWKPIFEDFHLIMPGMKWNSSKFMLEDPCYIPQKFNSSLNDFLKAAENIFSKYKNEKIGVQLSGGMDSSLIIGLLKHFKIPFFLIGMQTGRYEFRTEKYIQEILKSYAIKNTLIDYELHLPFNELENLPFHNYPDLLVINYSSDKSMAKECEKLGVSVLFSGDGGDTVFSEPMPLNPNDCTWLPQTFINSWSIEYVYSSHGVKLVPFYAELEILDVIYNLRVGQGEDNLKIWARNYFKEFLPKELVDYAYCADFWGLYVDGLHKAIPTIKKLFERAYKFTSHYYFSEKEFDKIFSQDLFRPQKEMYQKIESRVAFAAWLYSIPK